MRCVALRYHLVAHDLAPVRAVLVGLDHGHVVVVVVDDERLVRVVRVR